MGGVAGEGGNAGLRSDTNVWTSIYVGEQRIYVGERSIYVVFTWRNGNQRGNSETSRKSRKKVEESRPTSRKKYQNLNRKVPRSLRIWTENIQKS